MNLLNVALLLICAVSTAHCAGNCDNGGTADGCSDTCLYTKDTPSSDVVPSCDSTAMKSGCHKTYICNGPDNKQKQLCYADPDTAVTGIYTKGKDWPTFCHAPTLGSHSTSSGGGGAGKGKGKGTGGGAAASMIYAISVVIPIFNMLL